MSYEALAFYTGLFGSLHCVTMCGPLILSFSFAGQSIMTAIIQKALYQLGRIMMYGCLGLLFGLIGKSFALLGLQQILSFITGAGLLFAGLNYFVRKKQASSSVLGRKILNTLTSLFGKFISKPYGGFFAGAINGLLPCGVTYIALAQAINTNSATDSARFMLFFGLGTLPLLFVTALSPLIFKRFRTPAFLVSILFLVAGSFLMARSFNLEIPYVSHSINTSNPVNCE
jgi:uncharacterized protein